MNAVRQKTPFLTQFASTVPGQAGWHHRLHGEPSLSEILADPIVHLVMRRDGISEPQLRTFLAEQQTRLRRRLCGDALTPPVRRTALRSWAGPEPRFARGPSAECARQICCM